MKAKIQRSMLLVLFVTILIFMDFDTGYVSEEPDAAKRRSESGGQVYPDCCRIRSGQRI